MDSNVLIFFMVFSVLFASTLWRAWSWFQDAQNDFWDRVTGESARRAAWIANVAARLSTKSK